MAQLLRSPWASQFDALLSEASSSLLLCAPYIGRRPCDRIRERITEVASPAFQVTILTDLSRNNILSGVTDVSALVDIAKCSATIEVRFLPSLHAKVYVADSKQAIVTSGNLTDNGLFRNFEYGVLFTDTVDVREITRDVLEYGALGTCVDRAQLGILATVVDELREMQRSAERALKSTMRQEFDRRLREVDDDILRVRVAGRTAHAIFAESILHLLKRGPMTTVDINGAVQRIHPDFCDDSVDRIIDGQHFGKKWKHGVRSAQAFLRRRGDIQLEGTLWRLTA